MDILDTAGQVEFTAMRDQYMRCGEGFIICYSVIDRHSYEEASEYRKLIQRVRLTEDIPVVLIANKSDLESLRKVRERKYTLPQFTNKILRTSTFIEMNVYNFISLILHNIKQYFTHFNRLKEI